MWRAVLVLGVVVGCSFNSPQVPGIDGAVATIDADRRDGAPDASMPMTPDAAVCGAACIGAGGSCNAVTNTCEITCVGTGSCGNVICPPGMPCQVTCVGTENVGLACTSVTCPPNQPCQVNCTGAPGVAGAVGDGCGSVNCNSACGCDVNCADGPAVDGIAVLGGGQGCQQTVQCPPGCDDNNGCTDVTPPPQCNTCP